MGTYVKKPVLVEALKWDGTPDGATGIIVWAVAHGGTITYVHTAEDHGLRRQDERVNELSRVVPNADAPAFLAVRTRDATGRVEIGDYVVRGTADEFYPCAADIFPNIYDERQTADHGSDIREVESVEQALARGHVDRQDGTWTF